MERIRVLSLLLIFLSVLACRQSHSAVKVSFINPDGSKSAVIQVEVVSTPEGRNQGLMYRRDLADDRGMLFVFPDEAPRTFWMKNTYLPLDIIFISKNWEVVSIIEQTTPLSLEQRFSGKAAQFVVEVKGGLAAKWGVLPGSTAQIEGNIPPASE